MPYVTIRKHKIFYDDEGAGIPLLFGHSYLWNAAMWQPQVEALSSSYRCIVPELWAHGRSDSLPDNSCSIETLADDYWIFAQSLGLERFAVVGLSVGGMWGGLLALNHPEAVSALVLMNTFLGRESEENRALYSGMLDAVEKAGAILPPIQETIVSLFFSPATIDENPGIVYRLKAALQFMPPERIPDIVAMGRGIFSRPSFLDNLREIKAPVLVAVGADDLSRPPDESRRMAEVIPNAHLEIIPCAGHISNLEQPDYVTGLLVKFLREAL